MEGSEIHTDMKNIKGYTRHIKESEDRNSLGMQIFGLTSYIRSDMDEIKELIKKGANVNVADERGYSLLHAVVASGQSPEFVRSLIDAGAQVNRRRPESGTTALHSAALWGYTELARILIEAGAEVEAETRSKETPLDYAVTWERPDVARLLIEAGADITKAFSTYNELWEFFSGDVAWIPQSRLPEEWRKINRSRGAFGRF